MTTATNSTVHGFCLRRTLAMALCVLALALPLAAQSKKPQVAVKTLNGLAISVTDLQRSVEFYQSLFGMRNYAPKGSPPMLALGAGPSFITMRQGPAQGLDYISLGVEGFNAEEVEKITNGNWLRLYREVFGAAEQVREARLEFVQSDPVLATTPRAAAS